ncbi:Putative short-chain dehydrogenase/reductase SDR, NAD(P)-binding domain superfamily [Septoria linicola]|uniref:Short-chain dehydrogenase/reductase SDR, NAD(P)-binding domain superfamily n=1 Tax=Septoria linicola TaxID=215465 RepID=A0A9Q9B1C4_9PEZI|nr:putative short-chain dehydrogenase/reductase SDR, NAD(P)-binding domain superfamily [Septoria linicola]USW54536.1 Putative short-chain dehydrogenase/reductase SDR, NAD(P)-binding domain superfamily [Septoria linicola]
MPAPAKPYRPYAALHAEPNGSGDQRPTAMQILKDEGLLDEAEQKLHCKTFMITGCSSGLGVETARALYAAGANVYMTVRPSKAQQGQQISQDIKASVSGIGKLELVLLDLADQASVRGAAEDVLKRSENLNVLICNAGIMMCPESFTAEGHEMHMGSNHFGHFLLFQLLKDRLLSSATPDFSSRVVVVSSAGHRFSPIRFDDMDFRRDGYNPILAYGQSKTANIYMASSIERHYGHQNLHASSVHPGVILDTDLPRYQTNDSLDGDFNLEEMRPLMKSVAQGAATQVWAATAKYLNDKGGCYLADCGECAPFREGDSVAAAGYGPHAYDEQAEERLWQISYEAVGVSA